MRSAGARAPFLDILRAHSDSALAGGIVAILLVILMPMPPWMVDPLLILNLTLSVVVLLTAACVLRPLEFSAFPSLLLVATFFRLALNIATTRLILGNAADGPLAAGVVVRTFGEFVAADNPLIGLIIFVVIVVVQFVVITRGATRVSEVAARFQLDAMPGKQLGVDADLSAGLIDQETAQERRHAVANEADFYGAMDGASKFVRGDAIAGLIIVAINIAGGIAVGVFYHDMSLASAVNVFSRLTIGDGLVSQVPALMVSVAAALLVTRSASGDRLGRDLGRQVLSNDRMLFIAAGFLVFLVPTGLPPIALIAAAAACAACGWVLRADRLATGRRDGGGSEELGKPAGDSNSGELSDAVESSPADARSLLRVDPLLLELGYRLLPLVDERRGGDLMRRVGALRERLALELGIVLPAVCVRDSRELAPKQYRIRLRGNSLGTWEAEPSGLLAVGTGGLPRLREGKDDPVGRKEGPEILGWPSFWLKGEDEVVPERDFLEPAEALALHLEETVRRHAGELLTREEVSRMLSDLAARSPALVEELVPGVVKLSDLQKMLQRLLEEGVSIRDFESILETLAFVPETGGDLDARVEDVRRALSRTVTASCMDRRGRLRAVVLDPALEEFLLGSLDAADGIDSRTVLDLDPQTVESIQERLAELTAALRRERPRPALLCASRLRLHFWRAVGRRVPRLAVISYDEVPDPRAVDVHATLRLEPGRRSMVTKPGG